MSWQFLPKWYYSNGRSIKCINIFGNHNLNYSYWMLNRLNVFNIIWGIHLNWLNLFVKSIKCILIIQICEINTNCIYTFFVRRAENRKKWDIFIQWIFSVRRCLNFAQKCWKNEVEIDASVLQVAFSPLRAGRLARNLGRR